MWNPFSKQTASNAITLKLNGMHCSSCALTIDAELEELADVKASSTSYAKGMAVVELHPEGNLENVKTVIEKLGYRIEG